MFEQYKKYIQDNPKGYWFKRKPFGWGWTPAKKEGWLILSAYIFIFVIGELIFIKQMTIAPSTIKVILYVIFVFTVTTALILVCYKKGEKPKWQWGWEEDKLK